MVFTSTNSYVGGHTLGCAKLNVASCPQMELSISWTISLKTILGRISCYHVCFIDEFSEHCRKMG